MANDLAHIFESRIESSFKSYVAVRPDTENNVYTLQHITRAHAHVYMFFRLYGLHTDIA